MNFKHGDKVTCYIDGVYINDARISINTEPDSLNAVIHICQNIKDGHSIDDKLGYKYSWSINNDFSSKLNKSGTIQVTDLKLADTRTEITWDNLQEGDVIVDKGGDECTADTVVNNKIVFYTNKNGHAFWDKKEDLVKAGYTIKQPTSSQPIPDETQKAIELLQANGYKVTKE